MSTTDMEVMLSLCPLVVWFVMLAGILKLLDELPWKQGGRMAHVPGKVPLNAGKALNKGSNPGSLIISVSFFNIFTTYAKQI